jgi:TRAP-type transport system small permease protein
LLVPAPEQIDMDVEQGANPDALPAPFHIRILRALTAALLFAMMSLGFCAVILRYVFNSPIQGAWPILGFLLGLIVFTSLPLISVDDRHITVDLFEQAFTGRIGAGARWFVALFNIGATGFIAQRMAAFAMRSYQMGQLSDMINMELWPFAAAFSVLSALACLMLLAQFTTRVRQAVGGRNDASGHS